VKVVVAVEMLLGTTEIREHVVVGPALTARLTPQVVIPRVSADVDHAVDRRRSTQGLTPGNEDLAIVQVGIGFGVVEPVAHLRRIENTAEQRDVDHRIDVAPARLQKENPVLGVFGKPIGQDATGRAGPHNDEVVGRHDCLEPSG